MTSIPSPSILESPKPLSSFTKAKVSSITVLVVMTALGGIAMAIGVILILHREGRLPFQAFSSFNTLGNAGISFFLGTGSALFLASIIGALWKNKKKDIFFFN